MSHNTTYTTSEQADHDCNFPYPCAHCEGTTSCEQPMPAPYDPEQPNIYELVQDDLEVRALEGRRKYGTFLQADNGRDVLRDIYEEILDAAQYIRQELYRRDGR